MNPAIFMDRDGTLIEDEHYIRDPSLVRLVSGTGEALRLLRSKGYLLFVVSNQSGVGRGIISDSDFLKVHSRFCDLLKNERAEISEFGYCFHRPDDQCQCRKPGPALIEKFQISHTIDIKKSFTVGDSACDVSLADCMGATGCLVRTGKGRATEEGLQAEGILGRYRVYEDLLAFAKAVP